MLRLSRKHFLFLCCSCFRTSWACHPRRPLFHKKITCLVITVTGCLRLIPQHSSLMGSHDQCQTSVPTDFSEDPLPTTNASSRQRSTWLQRTETDCQPKQGWTLAITGDLCRLRAGAVRSDCLPPLHASALPVRGGDESAAGPSECRSGFCEARPSASCSRHSPNQSPDFVMAYTPS